MLVDIDTNKALAAAEKLRERIAREHFRLSSGEVLQVTVSFVLLAESLSHDWHLAQVRLFNSLIGVVLAMLVALLMHGLEQWLNRRKEASQR